MKNKRIAAAVIALLLMLSGCARDGEGTKCLKAYIRMPDGTVTVENVGSRSYVGNGYARIYLLDGRTIWTSSANVVLEEKP